MLCNVLVNTNQKKAGVSILISEMYIPEQEIWGIQKCLDS